MEYEDEENLEQLLQEMEQIDMDENGPTAAKEAALEASGPPQQPSTTVGLKRGFLLGSNAQSHQNEAPLDGNRSLRTEAHGSSPEQVQEAAAARPGRGFSSAFSGMVVERTAADVPSDAATSQRDSLAAGREDSAPNFPPAAAQATTSSGMAPSPAPHPPAAQEPEVPQPRVSRFKQRRHGIV